ncbi:hypothetical protein [Clostridium thermarum]|uniref:hypothetical protein n=1 Tax=Clostridium thermarum TaxID=1716543 RepID=UPI00111D19EB|nr:hypothetical protein [Clostridium thermarum]
MKKLSSLILIIVICFSLLLGCAKKALKDESQTKLANSTKIENTETSVPVENKAEEKIELTQEDAVENVKKLIGDIAEGYALEFDHMDKRDGKDYFVIHLYETVIDDPDTGEGHRATVTWYFIDKSNGEVYEWDLVADKLNKVSNTKD